MFFIRLTEVDALTGSRKVLYERQLEVRSDKDIELREHLYKRFREMDYTLKDRPDFRELKAAYIKDYEEKVSQDA